jgi:hypothetical protein
MVFGSNLSAVKRPASVQQPAKPARRQAAGFFIARFDEVKAVLVDPELDVMIRRLYDSDSGRRYLDPIVTITDSSGDEVATGKLPFG